MPVESNTSTTRRYHLEFGKRKERVSRRFERQGDENRSPHDTGQEGECTSSLLDAIKHAERSDSELDVCSSRTARKAQLRRIELSGQRAANLQREARSQKVISRKVKRQTKTTFLVEKGAD